MRESHPLAGKTVKLNLQDYPPDIPEGSEYRIEDWWENGYGKSWMFSDGNPAALRYAIRSGLAGLPVDDEVVYGKVGLFGHLIHVSELGEVLNNAHG